jgi:hypothetical protein
MAADLEALYDHYRRGGHDEGDAARLAEERLLASPEALQSLVLLHTTGYERFATRAAGRLRWGFDALLFLTGVVPLLLFSGYVVATGAASPNGMLRWGLVGLGMLAAGISFWKAFQLLISRDRSSSSLNRGLFTLLFVGMVGPVVGGAAFVHALSRIAHGIETSSAVQPVVIAEQVVSSGTDLTLSILIAIAAALVWFVLVNRIAAIEQEESAALLGT